MVERDEHRVVHAAAGAPACGLGPHPACGTKEQQRLVEQMRAEVGEGTAALADVLAPYRVDLRKALEPRLDAVERTQGPLTDEPADGQEVAVPATVLVHGEQAARARRRVDEALRVRDGRRDRLFDDDVAAGLQR